MGLLIPSFIAPLLMAGFGYFIMKTIVFDLVDEVWDCGDSLVVKDKGREQRIALSDCMNVSYSSFSGPPRITLMLRNTSEFGTEISFVPPIRMFPYSTSPIAKDLIARIDAARSASK